MKFNSRNQQLRISIVFLGFVSAYFVLLGRAWQLHVLADERISKMDKQFVRQITLSSQRGTIYDRKGQALAISLKVPSVFIDPATFSPTADQLRVLGKKLNMRISAIRKKIESGSRRFAWVKRFIDPTLNNELKELKIKGLYITHEWKRFYPDKELAGQVLGFVGFDGKGLEGLEKFYDERLRREEKVIRTKKDGKGRVIYYEDTQFLNEKKDNHIRLSLDSNLQSIVEEEMLTIGQKSNSKSGVGIMVNPKSGEILAMASYPPVNPNHFSKYSPQNWRNRPVQEVVEPGSTFKMFTIATAVDQKIIQPNQIFHCARGSLSFGKKEIKNIINKSWLTPKGILKFSNNVGTARIGLEIGPKKFFKAMNEYGFGKRLGLGFPGEAKGIFSNPSQWYPIDLANMSYGQGIAVSALQLSMAASVLANGGQSVQPNLVLEGASKRKSKSTRVVSKSTTKLIHSWLEAVTEEEGTGTRARVAGYRVAGKTGTAQLLDREKGIYSHSKVFSSFLGFAPLPDPEVVLMIGFREPDLTQGGGEIAAPVFSKVISRTMSYLDIPASENRNEVLHPRLRASLNKRIPEELNINENSLKNLSGMTMREVFSYGEKQGLKINVKGNGLAYSQKPKAGDEIPNHKKITVYFGSSLNERKI